MTRVSSTNMPRFFQSGGRDRQCNLKFSKWRYTTDNSGFTAEIANCSCAVANNLKVTNTGLRKPTTHKLITQSLFVCLHLCPHKASGYTARLFSSSENITPGNRRQGFYCKNAPSSVLLGKTRAAYARVNAAY